MAAKDLRLLQSYEAFEYSPEMIKESKEQNGGKIILRGIMQKADTLNQNGRLYPRAILEREVRNYQKFIIENRALGELDHPDTSVINLKNASHIVREAKMEQDGTVRGAIELLDTPSGKIAQSLIESGVKIGISSRGVGSVSKTGNGEHFQVEADYNLVCWDIVGEPSTPQAFMLPEGKQLNAFEINQLFTKSDRIDRILNDILSK
jgi:hypothetical protein